MSSHKNQQKDSVPQKQKVSFASKNQVITKKPAAFNHREYVAMYRARAALALSRKTALGDYFDAKRDPKDIALASKEMELCDKQLTFTRAAAREFLGTRVVAIVLRRPLNIAAVAGVVASATAFDATQCTEFAALASLFDEFRVSGGTYVWWSQGRAFTFSTGNTTPEDVMAAHAYDPSDAVAVASIAEFMDFQQHSIYTPVALNTTPGTAAAAVSQLVYARNGGRPHEFSFRTGPAKQPVVVNSAGAVVAQPGEWKPTLIAGGAVPPDGWLKSYVQGLGTLTGFSGVLCHHCQFRCRN